MMIQLPCYLLLHNVMTLFSCPMFYITISYGHELSKSLGPMTYSMTDVQVKL
jgi:hypothetical protein